MELLSSNIKKTQETEIPKKIPQISGNGNPKKAFYISGNGNFQSNLRKFLIFQETETLKKSLYFRKRRPRKSPYTSGNGNFLYFRKRKFLVFQERYIQKPNIFRTLVYSKPKTYSKHLQTSTMDPFAKIATQRTFQPQSPKLLPKKILIFFPKKPAPKEFLIFSQKSPSFSGNGNLEKSPCISRNGTFLYFRKQDFLFFKERYIQNPSIFRTRSIFRTLAYSESCQVQSQKHIQNTGIFRTLAYSET